MEEKLYDDDINSIWSLLNSWITETAPAEPLPPPTQAGNTLLKTFNIVKKEKEGEDILKIDGERLP